MATFSSGFIAESTRVLAAIDDGHGRAVRIGLAAEARNAAGGCSSSGSAALPVTPRTR